MSPAKSVIPAPPRVRTQLSRLALELGRELRDARLRRGWRLADVATKAGVSVAAAHAAESGRVASVEMYVRLAMALGLTPRLTVMSERGARPSRDVDPVHAAMGEVEADHLRALGHEVLIDEPYQYFQFAGRADVVAIDRRQRSLLHLENRTRFPDIQAFAGAYNAKRAYLAAELAKRYGISGAFQSQTHVVVALWSSEVLHALRLREQTFRSVCPDSTAALQDWWSGTPPSPASPTSALVVFDPLPGQRSSRRRWAGLDLVRSIEPRYRGYADALEALRGGGIA